MTERWERFEKAYAEPCESCGTPLLKKDQLTFIVLCSEWQYEAWAVPDGDLFRFVEHTHDRCAEVRASAATSS